ncbi:hypothetical protein EG328_012049 [Venturia inaequalis]|uniref:Uncharacterized protein n=1 Tax=Venturia inaequalis TaxID=5025 RepID=A0A8H3U5W3_VENIN|nr:hypothetical protein EG328_012049 [Venturia inaequalis]
MAKEDVPTVPKFDIEDFIDRRLGALYYSSIYTQERVPTREFQSLDDESSKL